MQQHKLNLIILPVDEEEWFLFHTCINGFTDMWNLEYQTKPNADLQRIDWWLPEGRVVTVGGEMGEGE